MKGGQICPSSSTAAARTVWETSAGQMLYSQQWMTCAHRMVQFGEMGCTGPRGHAPDLVRRSCLRQLPDPLSDFLLWQLTYKTEILITLIRVMTTLDSRLHFKNPCIHQRAVFTLRNISIIMGATGGHTRIYPAAISHADQMRESCNTLNAGPWAIVSTHFVSMIRSILHVYFKLYTKITW